MSVNLLLNMQSRPWIRFLTILKIYRFIGARKHNFYGEFSTRFECSFRIFPTRFECSFKSSPLVSSVVLHLPHSFRVSFYIFPTRFECSFSTLIDLNMISEAERYGHLLMEEDEKDVQVKLHSKRVEKM